MQNNSQNNPQDIAEKDIMISVEIDDDIIEINKYWHKLEFDKIMKKLADECSFS